MAAHHDLHTPFPGHSADSHSLRPVAHSATRAEAPAQAQPGASTRVDPGSVHRNERSPAGIALLLLLLIAVAMPSPVLSGQPADVRGVRPYWVFFRDRGPMELDASAVMRAAQAVSPQAWARRSAAGSSLPTVQDLDLWEPYVEAVTREGRLRRRSRWLNAVSVDVSAEAAGWLADLDFVREVRPVAVGRAQGTGPEIASDGTPLGVSIGEKIAPPPSRWPHGPAYGQLQEIGALALHDMGFTGNRVRTMILDTGFRKDHNAFARTDLLSEWDFVFDDGDTQDEPEDYPGQHNHGTGCWAVAGGYDPGRIVGPAYGATFVLAKTEDLRSETQAEEDNYVAALEWADELGVRVTSASLIYLCFDDGFCYDYPLKDGETAVITQAVNIAAERGILCVNAIGNYGSNGPGSLGTPADAYNMLAVGAVDSLNIIASWSSRGPSDDGRTKPEVMARGVQTWWASAGGVDAYAYANGTSLAAPLVGGAAALLAEAHPEWGPSEIRDALMMTADRAAFPDNNYGWGRINLEAALHWTPLVYPLPFDLLAPEDGASGVFCAPTFVWRRSTDPDSDAPLNYSVWIRELEPGNREWLLSAGTDTTLTLHFALDPFTDYTWEVLAEDVEGHVRQSRQSYGFMTGDSTASPEPDPDHLALSVTAGPNPFRDQIRFRTEGTVSVTAWKIFDPVGRRVASGVLSDAAAEVTWDGRDEQGRQTPPGVYYVRLESASRVARTTIVRVGAE